MPLAAGMLNHVLPTGYEHLITAGSVTRFDATVDVAHATIDEMLLYYPGVQYSTVITKSGKTTQLGTTDSPNEYVIYDKVAEIKAKNRKKVEALREPFPGHPVTRIEARLRPKARTSLADLHHVPNPFKKLVVAAYIGCEYRDDDWKNFLARCRYEGLQGALLAQSKRRRKLYLQRLKQQQADWWDADNVWAGLGRVLEQIADPPSAKPTAVM